jgi:hypothetical protein
MRHARELVTNTNFGDIVRVSKHDTIETKKTQTSDVRDYLRALVVLAEANNYKIPVIADPACVIGYMTNLNGISSGSFEWVENPVLRFRVPSRYGPRYNEHCLPVYGRDAILKYLTETSQMKMADLDRIPLHIHRNNIKVRHGRQKRGYYGSIALDIRAPLFAVTTNLPFDIVLIVHMYCCDDYYFR